MIHQRQHTSLTLLFVIVYSTIVSSSLSVSSLSTTSEYNTEWHKTSSSSLSSISSVDAYHVDSTIQTIPSTSSITILHNATNHNHNTIISPTRNLAVGDFDRFNELFANAVIALPDTTIEQDYLQLNLQNIRCSNFVIGDIITSWDIYNASNNPSNISEGFAETLGFDILIDPFSLKCTSDFSYKFGLLGLQKGSGSFQASISDSKANMRVDINSLSGFQQEFPSSVDVEYCYPTLNVDSLNIDADSGFMDTLFDLADKLIRNVVEDKTSTALCDTLDELGPGLFTGFLNSTKVKMDKWMEPVSDELADPLYIEKKNFTKPSNIRLLDFMAAESNNASTIIQAGSQDNNDTSSTSSIGNLLAFAMQQTEATLGRQVEDPNGPNGETDLAINVMLRRSDFLDENRVLKLNFSNNNEFFGSLQDGKFSPVISETSDKLTETKITLVGARITGLDTMTTFSPFVVIGNYTLQNNLAWDSLAFEIDLMISMKPSTSPDSVLVDPDAIELIENITISTDITKINLNTSLFLALDVDKLEALQVGSLLSFDNLIPCFLQAFYDFQVSGLIVTIEDMTEPTLSGFVSPGIDRVVSSVVKAALAAFKPTVLKAMPNIFQGPVRDKLSKKFLNDFLKNNNDNKNRQCPDQTDTIATMPEYIDFRDLLLNSTNSKKLGGSGNEMYGTIVSRIYDLLQNMFTNVGDDGEPMINQKLIRPYTKSQSGTEGMFQINRDFFNIGNMTDTSPEATKSRLLSSALNELFSGSSVLGQNINLALSNLRLINMDTIQSPLVFLQPTDDAHILKNKITMGNGTDRPINITMQLSTGLFGDENQIDLSMSFASFEILLDLFAMVKTKSFMEFPLGDAFTIDCWLASIEAVDMDPNGVAVDPKAQSGLAIQSFASNITSFSMGTSCISCESAGTKLLPELFQILEDTNATSTLGGRLPSLIQSLIQSSSMKTFLDRRVKDAGMFCPSNAAYKANAVRPDYGKVNFPALPAQSIDTLLYAATLLGHVGTIVFAESQREKDIETTDPLSAQKAFRAPKGMRLINWMNISGSTGLSSSIDEIFNQTRKSLVNSTEDGLGGLFNISEVIGKYLDDDGVLDLEINLGIDQEDLSLLVKSVRIEGLNKFKLSDLFEPIGPQTLSLSAQFDVLKVKLGIVADSPSTKSEPPQEFSVAFSVENASVDIALFLAFDLDRIGNIQLGSLLDVKSIMQCILSTAYKFEISQMNVAVGNFSNPTFTGFLSDTEAAVSRMSELIFDTYKSKIIAAIPKIFGGVVKESISDIVGSQYNESNCPNAADKIDELSFVDFRDLFLTESDSVLLGGSGTSPYGNLFRAVYKLLNDELLVTDPKTGLAAINEKLITKVTESKFGKAGEWLFSGDLLNQAKRVQAGGLNVSFQVRAYDAYIRNLDTVGAPLALLAPLKDEASILNNTATIGLNRPLTLGIGFFILLANDATQIKNDLGISIGMDELQLLLTALLKLSEEAFLRFPIKDVGNLQCWLATIPSPPLDKYGLPLPDSEDTLRIEDFSTTVDKVKLEVDCKNCSGSKMIEFADLISSEKNIDAVSGLAEDFFTSATKLIKGEYLRVAFDRALNNAAKQCPHHPLYDSKYVKSIYEPLETDAGESSLSLIVGFMILCVTLALAISAILLAVRLFVRRRHRKWLENLSSKQLLLICKQQKEADDRELVLNTSTSSMFKSSSIPYWVRLTMPLIILGNIGFFLSGHLSLGGSVSILLTLGSQTLRSDDFFSFSMAKSTIEIWNAGGKALAMIIFIASFAWPYTKQVITLGLWFTPPNRVSVTRRCSILLWLDALAKWSFIDIFVLVVTLVCIRVSIKSPDVTYLPDDFYQLDLLVVPKWGLYANMTAQLISQISSHYIIHYHRRLVDDALNLHLQSQPMALETGEQDDETGSNSSGEQRRVTGGRHIEINSESEKLCNHAFRRPHRGEEDKLVPRRPVAPMLVFFALCIAVFVVVGCILPSYSVRILGIIGVMVESGQGGKPADTNYSVISTMQVLFSQAKLTGGLSDYIGLGTLSIIFLLTILIVPIMQAVTLLVQWFASLNQLQRHNLSVFLEILQAWQYAEVYLLAILVGSWQLGSISEYLVNPYCKPLQGMFGQLAYYGILKPEDAQCLKTEMAVEPTFYLLFVGAIILAFVNTFVMKAVTQYFHEIDTAKTRLLHQKAADLDDLVSLEDDESTEENKISVHPVPVMYTDTFRWLLYREDAMLRLTKHLPVTETYDMPNSPVSSLDRGFDVVFDRDSGAKSDGAKSDIEANNYEPEIAVGPLCNQSISILTDETGLNTRNAMSVSPTSPKSQLDDAITYAVAYDLGVQYTEGRASSTRDVISVSPSHDFSELNDIGSQVSAEERFYSKSEASSSDNELDDCR